MTLSIKDIEIGYYDAAHNFIKTNEFYKDDIITIKATLDEAATSSTYIYFFILDAVSSSYIFCTNT